MIAEVRSVEIVKGKAATRAKNKYNSQNYDSVRLVVPKGRKPKILAVAEAAGDSLNGYINKAIEYRMRSDKRLAANIYTIIGGINGTGKSSFTGVLRTQATDLGVIIDVDKLAATAGVTPIEGGKIAIRRIKRCLDYDANFTQETTLSGYRPEIIARRATELGYYIRLLYIGLDTPEECIRRIANRMERGGHKIGEDDVRRRFVGRWDSLNKILPYCDEVLFFDNDNGFVEVAEYYDGQFLLKGESRPDWVLELSEYLEKAKSTRI